MRRPALARAMLLAGTPLRYAQARLMGARVDTHWTQWCWPLAAALTLLVVHFRGKDLYAGLIPTASASLGAGALVAVISLFSLVATRQPRVTRPAPRDGHVALLEAEERALYGALHDSLTGLPNRAMLLLRVRACLARGRLAGARPWAVLLVDIDRFRDVNDRLGQAIGDRLLVEVARKLRGCVRHEDCVARLGADEFAILLEEPESPQMVSGVVARVLGTFAESLSLDGHTVGISAGVSVVGGGALAGSPADLLQDADAAMRRAKQLGRGRCEVFDSRLRDRARARLDLQEELRYAVERKEIHVAYQPIVSLVSGRVCGFEALARWEHGGRSIPPDEFIPLAEETALISTLELSVMQEATRQLAVLQERFPLREPLTMNLNLSIRHLGDPELFDHLRQVLGAAPAITGSLCLELTEGLFLGEDALTFDLLQRIRELGFKLAIDDFGTGYSSLSYLSRLPLDVVKLDASFVREMESRVVGRPAIVEAIVRLAGQLSLEVVAEGVETSAQVARLRRLGCDKAQGYFFSKPVDAATAAAVVAREVEALDGSLQRPGVARPGRDGRPG